MKLFLGWDVGGWHCDKNRESRDALVAVTADPTGALRVVGHPWRGNLRSVLMHREDVLIDNLLQLCGLRLVSVDELVIAIDAPLGWPEPMLALLASGATSAVSESDATNPYTRRATELDLVARGHAPLSTVRDMIGSQSIKAIHFLAAASLKQAANAVWQSKRNIQVRAIETYPAVALTSETCRGLHEPIFSLMQRRFLFRESAMPDLRDALVCAIVAYLVACQPDRIRQPPDDFPKREGWIFAPL